MILSLGIVGPFEHVDPCTARPTLGNKHLGRARYAAGDTRSS